MLEAEDKKSFSGSPSGRKVEDNLWAHIIQNSELARIPCVLALVPGPSRLSQRWLVRALCDDEMENRGLGSPFNCHFSLPQL